ncbi:MAG: exopolysaccharide biosynthesis protein [Chlamydiae bacterium CG10_big_fil_rev_8_21_14_0_10_35_9]|nr:MAG: exopolysaccharide biosynthesis protein [Chlamydiae bacterium CG10_big_fil_rev_8_21_14_0_10_35_9]
MVTGLIVQSKIKHKPVKRLFDICFSFLVLSVGLPFYILISLIIFASSPGPIFYVQPRVGRKGKIIKCFKFRTMCINAEEKLKKILESDAALKEEYNKFRKLKNDPRVFSFGKFLRKTSLDELPQFFNVLLGDLSVVGPRPAMPSEVEKFFKNRAEKILSIRPGITGIWQTSGRNNLSFEDRVKLDEIYVDSQSFKKDMELIIKTIPMLFFSKGAY